MSRKRSRSDCDREALAGSIETVEGLLEEYRKLFPSEERDPNYDFSPDTHECKLSLPADQAALDTLVEQIAGETLDNLDKRVEVLSELIEAYEEQRVRAARSEGPSDDDWYWYYAQDFGVESREDAELQRLEALRAIKALHRAALGLWNGEKAAERSGKGKS
jgi:hypothetical protein